MKEETRKLKIGIVGCGPIAQFAHLEACQKAKNVELYAICDTAEDLLARVAQIWRPRQLFGDYLQMLADPDLDAVIIATADAFHVPLSILAVRAGKHVLVEKPLSASLDECLELSAEADKHQLVVQIGHMKRFDPGLSYARKFINEQLGELLAIKAWYGDNTHRYTATDNLQPVPITSSKVRKPAHDPKADLEKYYLMAHGSHLLDTARFLGGEIGSLRARLRRRSDAYCWFVETTFRDGTLGHLDLTIKLRGDWHEGFQVYGLGGSVFGKTHNPWFYKSSEVECYLEEDQTFYRPLGADGFSYRRQLEHFADVILNGRLQQGASIQEGLETVRGMIAISRSVRENKTIYLDDITSGTLY